MTQRPDDTDPLTQRSCFNYRGKRKVPHWQRLKYFPWAVGGKTRSKWSSVLNRECNNLLDSRTKLDSSLGTLRKLGSLFQLGPKSVTRVALASPSSGLLSQKVGGGGAVVHKVGRAPNSPWGLDDKHHGHFFFKCPLCAGQFTYNDSASPYNNPGVNSTITCGQIRNWNSVRIKNLPQIIQLISSRAALSTETQALNMSRTITHLLEAQSLGFGSGCRFFLPPHPPQQDWSLPLTQLPCPAASERAPFPRAQAYPAKSTMTSVNLLWRGPGESRVSLGLVFCKSM